MSYCYPNYGILPNCDSYPNVIKSQNYTYVVTVAPTNLAVSLANVKLQLKIDASDTSQDAYLTLLIRTVQQFVENYTGRTLITTTYKTFRDCFACCFELRRSVLQSVTSVKYLLSGVFTTIADTTYYVTSETDYSRILLAENKDWPTDKDNQLQSIEIVFDAGYGDDDTDIPYDLTIAMLNHITKLYENRGDCDSDCSAGMSGVALPIGAKNTYDQYKINSIFGNTWRC